MSNVTLTECLHFPKSREKDLSRIHFARINSNAIEIKDIFLICKKKII